MNRRAFFRHTTYGLLATACGLVSTARAQQLNKRKFVIVGDGGVGKSALTIRYITNLYLGDYDPTIADFYRKQVKLAELTYLLELFDTVSQPEFDESRRASYAGADLFLICFDLANRAAFANVESRWVPEIARHAAKTPFMVVGCKSDLRGSAACVSADEALALARKLEARGYRECSAKTNDGVEPLIAAALRSTVT